MKKKSSLPHRYLRLRSKIKTLISGLQDPKQVRTIYTAMCVCDVLEENIRTIYITMCVCDVLEENIRILPP